jgi:cell wall-associated NlpC family hydrolase
MADTTITAASSVGSQIVQAAKKVAQDAAGKPYIWGGTTLTGFDCSGYVSYAYKQVFPDFGHMNTTQMRTGGKFIEVKTAAPGDLVFFPAGTNPYEVEKHNKKVFPEHVGIVLDEDTWIGSQSSTGVAQVPFDQVWWSARKKIFLHYTGLPPTPAAR